MVEFQLSEAEMSFARSVANLVMLLNSAGFAAPPKERRERTDAWELSGAMVIPYAVDRPLQFTRR